MNAANRWPAFATISLVVFGLIAASLIKAFGFDLTFFGTHSPGLSGLQSLVTIIAILTAGAIAFVKFFAHGLFVRRANVRVSVHVHRKDPGNNWHVVEIEIGNKGSLALIVKAVEWSCTHFHESGDRRDCLGSDLFMPPDSGSGAHVILSGESELAMMEPYAVRRDAVISSYRATFTDLTGKSWHAYCVIGNRDGAGGSEN